MHAIQKTLRELVERAQNLHQRVKRISLESVLIISECEGRRAAINFGMTTGEFAKLIHLTPSQYWKRAQVARVFLFFPEAKEMVHAGQTKLSHLVLISPKITKANCHILLPGIKGKSRRHVETLVSRVTMDGQLLPQGPNIKLRLELNHTQAITLDRARTFLRRNQAMPSLSEIFTKALQDFLAHHDPLHAPTERL